MKKIEEIMSTKQKLVQSEIRSAEENKNVWLYRGKFQLNRIRPML
jgi:hypothetical protein